MRLGMSVQAVRQDIDRDDVFFLVHHMRHLITLMGKIKLLLLFLLLL
jgi:hypothetical protein